MGIYLMATLSSLVSAGGGGGTLFTIPITKSKTWTPPFDGTAVIHCIGAGGSGGCSVALQTSTAGGGGGYSKKTVTLSTGTNWTMVVGAGGIPKTVADLGATGGNTTATDGSSSLVANGGAGGHFNNAGTVLGGTASGGDVNNSGGRGAGTTGSSYLTYGGGAVGVLGTGQDGSETYGQMAGSGGHSDVQSPQFENTNGELRGGGRGGQSINTGQKDDVRINTISGGFLAGGGGSRSNTGNHCISGGDGGIGGGGGNVSTYQGSEQARSGAGGNGLIIVMYTAIG